MAYTTPTTRSTGNTITAAIWNADVVDNIKYLAGDSGGKTSARVYNTAAIACTNGTATALTFDSEVRDNGGMHSTASNTSRLTVPAGAAGLYLIGGHITWDANATGVRELQIRLNGTTYIAIDGANDLAASALNQSVVTAWPCAVGDYVELLAYQTSGGNLNVASNGLYSPHFWALWTGI